MSGKEFKSMVQISAEQFLANTNLADRYDAEAITQLTAVFNELAIVKVELSEALKALPKIR